ncbi:MAG: glycosyltransferase family 2 protein [Candidatus Moranbacteria bacterium]|nr:glycosyltransferase family 2 protein [Candidatus Moranbacteria bacterium]
MKTFSIVTPVYYNELNIPYTIPELKKLGNLLPEYKLEFIFVDDGSGDRSLPLLLEERKKDDRIKIVKLSKNFGMMSAIQAGIHFAEGDCVGVINADLQDPPELFVEMVRKWEAGNKIVIATRKDRDDPFLQKLASNTFYFLMATFAIKDYPRGGFDFVLFDKKVVIEIDKICEKNTNIMSLIFWLGFKKAFVYYVRKERKHGKSRWTLSKKIKLFVDSFVAFSYAPIRIISFLGLVIACVSFLFGAYTIFDSILGKIPVQGFTTLIAIITFLLGLIMIMLGIIGEYLWRILDETRKRPSYVIDEVYIDKE